MAGGGISIANVSTAGNTASTLTISNIADTQGGDYICRTTSVPDVTAPISVQGTASVVACWLGTDKLVGPAVKSITILFPAM